MHRLFQPITSLKYVAQKRAKLYAKLDITTPYDLLYHLPRHYMDYRNPISIAEAQNQTLAVLRVQILQKLAPQFVRSGLTVFKAIAEDDTAQITVVLYNNHFAMDALTIGSTYYLYGKIGGNLLRKEIYSPHIIPASSNQLIRPIYALTTGLTVNMIETNVRQALNLLEEEPFEWMPGWLLTQYHLPLLTDALQEIHFPHSMKTLEQARRRLAFDELLQLQIGMRMLRKRCTGHGLRKSETDPCLWKREVADAGTFGKSLVTRSVLYAGGLDDLLLVLPELQDRSRRTEKQEKSDQSEM